MCCINSEWHFALLSLKNTLHLVLHCFRVKCISIKYCVSWYVEIWASTRGRLLEVAPVFHTSPIRWSSYFMRYCSYAFTFRLLSESTAVCRDAYCVCALAYFWTNWSNCVEFARKVLGLFCLGSEGTQLHLQNTFSKLYLSISHLKYQYLYHVYNCLICIKLNVDVMLFWRPFLLIVHGWLWSTAPTNYYWDLVSGISRRAIHYASLPAASIHLVFCMLSKNEWDISMTCSCPGYPSCSCCGDRDWCGLPLWWSSPCTGLYWRGY